MLSEAELTRIKELTKLDDLRNEGRVAVGKRKFDARGLILILLQGEISFKKMKDSSFFLIFRGNLLSESGSELTRIDQN